MRTKSVYERPVPVVVAVLLGLATVPTSAFGQAAGDSSDVATGAEERVRVEEIVVRARKRAEALEDTPVAVTALAPSTLRDVGVSRIDDILGLVPNLNFGGSLQGNANRFQLRGIGTGSVDLQFDPGVGVYLDGVYLPRSFGSLIDVVDVAQIEVLRGPQGTLFGKNTVGGAILVTTQKPHDELEASVRVRAGNFNLVETRAMLNVPLVEDRVFSRLAFASTNRDGYVKNVVRGDDLNDVHKIAAIGGLRFIVNDDITFDVTGMYAKDDSHARSGQCVPTGANASLLALIPDTYFDECRQTTPLEARWNTHSPSRVESYGTWGVLNWNVGDVGPLDDLSFKAQGAWNEQIPRNRYDIDGTSLDIVTQNAIGGSPFDGEPGLQEQIFGELQINASAFDGRLNVVGGYFVFWEYASEVKASNALFINRLSDSRIQTNNWTWAPYFQATADITDWLSITGGLRYTEDKKGLTLETIDTTSDTVVFPETEANAIFSRFTPMGNVSLTVPEDLLPDQVDHLMGYFTYSQGFKGGGFNALPGPAGQADMENNLGSPFGPEVLDNYEIGFKTILFEQRLSINTAFFLGKYDDIQKINVQAVGFQDDGVPIIQRITQNAAKAEIKGFEIEAQAFPTERLQLTGSLGYQDTEFTDFGTGCTPGADTSVLQCAVSDFDGSTIDRSGESFNNTPKLQTHLSAQYTFSVFEGTEGLEGSITPRLDWFYRGKTHNLGPEVDVAKQGSIHLLNARLAYNFADDRAQIALWAKNLTNEIYSRFAYPISSTFGVVHNLTELPRTYGVEVSYRY